MLRNLTIKNYALIDHLELNPSPFLNIVTGETGAGKSIMLGAVGMLLGNRADTKVLSDRTEKCFIEGEFDISDYNLETFFDDKDLDYDKVIFIRREIGVSGKSRAFVNDTPVTLDTLKELGTFLMDIHSQNETILLGSSAFQLKLIDDYAETKDSRQIFQSEYGKYIEALTRFQLIKDEEGMIRKEADFNNFLLDELNKADFHDGEQDQLEKDLEVLEHSEEIKTHFNQALDIISQAEYSSITSLESALQELRHLINYSETYKVLYNRLESMLIELSDLNDEINTLQDKIEYDPKRTAAIQERLGLLYHLQQKHQVSSIGELQQIREELVEKVNKFHNLDKELESAEKEMRQAENEALKEAKALSQKRKDTFEPFCSQLSGMLVDLGMNNARIEISHEQVGMSSTGIDSVTVNFSASKGVKPKPLKSVASGGEFSRLMFVIKYVLASKTSLPTIIFDEIDSGVSGEIALKLGTMMKEMAQNHQVISISHLPQIAAKAERHFYVYKDILDNKSVSRIRMLSEEERIEEIAKMIAGDKPTDSAISSAKELMVS